MDKMEILSKIQAALTECFSKPSTFEFRESLTSTADVLRAEADFPNRIPHFNWPGLEQRLTVHGFEPQQFLIKGSIGGQKVELTIRQT